MKILGKKGAKGFTVSELMIVVGLSSVVFMGVLAILRVGTEQSQLSQTKMLLQDTAREALYKMVQEIRQSAPSRITIAGNSASIQFAVPDPASLVSTTSYTVNWTGAHQIQYALGGAGNRQILRTDLATNRTSVLANDVTALQFTGDAAQPNVVTITISAQRNLTSGRPVPSAPLQLTAQAEVRNP
ncbi:MAG TPA: hypothetical protein P5561_02770 [Candidatus Omnitrophota bacterium]|nr:hypothetical protein [Candidatus Omnitrophota bacterium]HRY85437.1 hypothetical protein [Candidatus Omnitrophota bacterium]